MTDSLGISDTMSLIRVWQPIGCLVDSEEIHLKTVAAFKGTPTAFSSRFTSYAGHSEKGITELAARHFRTLGFTNFAFPAGPAVSSALRTRFCAWLRKQLLKI